ncbi:MAG TPA: type IV secretory system conjugative DNA transfer family protein, partial [Pyrinomonadaceae bacterium]|nr:type IV secretory system conjugative DNA transfer family protein [Pyrinomonadaceae bacterium]
MSFNIKEKSQRWDAIYGFPRPANEQYLSSYKAFLRLSKDYSTGMLTCFLSILSTVMLAYTYYYTVTTFRLAFLEGIGALMGLLLLVLVFGIWLIFVLDVIGIMLPYRLEFQRESHGGRTWATVHDLQKENIDAIRPSDADIRGKGVFLAPFKRNLLSGGESKHQIFLSTQRMSQAMVIYGPPGSGKSSTFFIPVIRQFGACGGAIVLDVKGELYNYTSHYYSNVYRLDIMNPLNSDWFDLFGGCYRNPDLARRIASYLVGYDPNKNSSGEPIWDQSAVSMLAIIILHLCETKEHPTARDILRFLASNPITDKRFNPEIGKNSPYSPLTEAFKASPNKFARDVWLNNFSKMPEDTFGSVKFNMDTALNQLLSPKVNEILRPPTAYERKKGR